MKSREFRRLQREWYAKLADSGFVDIERHNLHADNPYMRQHKHEVQVTLERGMLVGRQEYFRRAGHWSWDRTFLNRKEAHIWRLHANGLSYREVAREVQVFPRCKPTGVFYAIKREAERMANYYGQMADS